jgi:arginase family enzyme
MPTSPTAGDRSAPPPGRRRPAIPSLIALEARISENTPRDLRGVRTLARLATARLGATPRVIAGRRGPFGRTAWQEDLEASRTVLAATAQRLANALAASAAPPLTLATDCSLALATVPVIARLAPAARLLWLDAHCDYDTPATTTIGFLGCMSLAGACGEWASGYKPPVPPGQVVLCGTRPAPDDFDIAGQRLVEASAVTLVSITQTTIDDVLAALGDAPVYVHLDPDVLDPSVNPVPYARPGGLSATALRALLAEVAERQAIIGVEITAFHSPDDAAEREALGELLIEAVAPLLATPRRGRAGVNREVSQAGH